MADTEVSFHGHCGEGENGNGVENLHECALVKKELYDYTIGREKDITWSTQEDHPKDVVGL